ILTETCPSSALPHTNPNIEISIVVPSYNSRRDIVECLSSIRQQSAGISFEVIVVDSSTDGTGELIRSRFPEVRLIPHETRMYPGAARNAGLSQARGDIVAFVDTKLVLPANWLECLAEKFRNPGLQ